MNSPPWQNGYRALPIGSQNFAQCGVIQHDRMTTATLQFEHDPTLIQKLHAHWKYLPDLTFIQTRSATYRPLRTDSQATDPMRRCGLPWRHRPVTLLSFSELRNLYCLQTMHFSQRKRSSSRTLPTALIVRDWENNGTICVFTCARITPPTVNRHQTNPALCRWVRSAPRTASIENVGYWFFKWLVSNK